MRLAIVASWPALMIIGGLLAAARAADEPSSWQIEDDLRLDQENSLPNYTDAP
jgi:hypothetical protein